MKLLESIINEEVALTVERIVRASRATALAAFEQHFSQFEGQAHYQQTSVHPSTPAKNCATPPKSQRSADEIGALETRFLDVVRSNPGELMVTLAPLVGAKPAELRVPVTRLKAKKRIKMVGQRQFTTYFPVDADTEVFQ